MLSDLQLKQTAVMHHLTKSPCQYLPNHHHHLPNHHHHHHHHNHLHSHHHHHHHHPHPHRRHHHHQHHHHCALHCRPNSYPSFASPTPRNLQPLASLTSPEDVNTIQEPSNSSSSVLQELEHAKLEKAEDDEEPVFVLTDEWMELFAKSEAKRKLEKKQAKKKFKN